MYFNGTAGSEMKCRFWQLIKRLEMFNQTSITHIFDHGNSLPFSVITFALSLKGVSRASPALVDRRKSSYSFLWCFGKCLIKFVALKCPALLPVRETLALHKLHSAVLVFVLLACKVTPRGGRDARRMSYKAGCCWGDCLRLWRVASVLDQRGSFFYVWSWNFDQYRADINPKYRIEPILINTISHWCQLSQFSFLSISPVFPLHLFFFF